MKMIGHDSVEGTLLRVPTAVLSAKVTGSHLGALGQNTLTLKILQKTAESLPAGSVLQFLSREQVLRQ